MLRGRHRGLPVAIDRAVMLPFEFRDEFDNGFGDSANGTADYLARRSSAFDAASERGTDDGGADVNNDNDRIRTMDRTRTLDRTYTQHTQTRPRSGSLLDPDAQLGRGRDAAPKRVSIHTVRDLESRVNDVVDQQLQKSGLPV